MNFLWFATAVCCLLQLQANCAAVKFQEVMDVIKEKRMDLSKHKFFEFLRDESIPETRRMTFAPYWTTFVLGGTDVLDNWIRVPEPKNDLELRINAFADEECFHYNLFLDDVETVLGCSVEKFGSYGAVLRHIWGDDSKAVRQLYYSWASLAKKYDDPMVVLCTFEVIEAGLKDFFEATFASIYKVGQSGGLKDLKYWGQTHMELEMNHTVTSWFQEGEQPFPPLEDYEVTEETKAHSLEVVDELFERYEVMYDALHNLALAEDSISPEKYQVEGLPAMSAFPAVHPNRPTPQLKDEL